MRTVWSGSISGMKNILLHGIELAEASDANCRGDNPWAVRAAGIKQRFPGSTITSYDLEKLVDDSEWLCYYCGTQVDTHCFGDPNNLQFDHVIPGINKLSNLVVSCGECNRKKQNNTLGDLLMFAEGINELV